MIYKIILVLMFLTIEVFTSTDFDYPNPLLINEEKSEPKEYIDSSRDFNIVTPNAKTINEGEWVYNNYFFAAINGFSYGVTDDIEVSIQFMVLPVPLSHLFSIKINLFNNDFNALSVQFAGSIFLTDMFAVYNAISADLIYDLCFTKNTKLTFNFMFNNLYTYEMGNEKAFNTTFSSYSIALNTRITNKLKFIAEFISHFQYINNTIEYADIYHFTYGLTYIRKNKTTLSLSIIHTSDMPLYFGLPFISYSNSF
jgi:hypothetical protein